jgi:putative FmdB family regulatory protein
LPTYSYSCRDCGTAFDIQQAFTDDALTECPNCGGSLRKMFGAVGVTFNGSGFYRTDSRNAAKSGKPADKPASSKPAADKPASGGASAVSSSSSSTSSSSS